MANNFNTSDVSDLTVTDISATGTVTIDMDDNASSTFRVKEGSNDYILINTTNSSELIQFSVVGEGFRMASDGNFNVYGPSVSHAFSGVTSVSNAGQLRKSASTGGLTFAGYRNAANALNFLGYRSTLNTDSGTGGNGAVLFYSAKHNGSGGATTCGDSEVMYSFHNAETTNPKVWINGNGTIATLADVKIPTGKNYYSDGVALSNLKWVQATVTAAALDGAGSVTVAAAATGDTYKIREVFLVGGGTNFGVAGDRNISLTDGTTTWTTIANADIEAAPAATLRWGDAKVPFLTGTSATASASGTAIVFKYTGGILDHGGTGSIVFSVCLEKIT